MKASTAGACEQTARRAEQGGSTDNSRHGS
jgi:hypothetical protein